jgi:hypothetical protein
LKVTVTVPSDFASASRMAAACSPVVVSGFSQMTSLPAASAARMYSWWVASTEVTMTVSGSVSARSFAKSAAA